MTGNSFVNSDRPRIHRCRAPEAPEFFRRLRHVADAILPEPRRAGEVVVLSEAKPAQILWSRSKRVMLDPIRDSQNTTFFKKFSDLEFSGSGVFDPTVRVRR